MHEQFVREQEVQERIDRVHHTANGPMTLTYTRIGRLKYVKKWENFETDRSKMGQYFPLLQKLANRATYTDPKSMRTTYTFYNFSLCVVDLPFWKNTYAYRHNRTNN